MKVCPKCQIPKRLDEFPRSSVRMSGIGAWCLVCHGAANRDRYNRTKKRARRPRTTPVFQKLSDEEWLIRKAESKERAKNRRNTGEFREYRRQLKRKYDAQRRDERRDVELKNDITRITSDGVKLKKSHHKICPILRFDRDVYVTAQKERKREREALRDPEQRRAGVRQWKKANPAAVSSQRFRRRVNLRNAPIIDLSESQWLAIKVAYRHRCAYCGEKKPLTQDHIIPVSKGGAHTASNIIPACQSCNSSKGARLPLVTYQPHLIA